MARYFTHWDEARDFLAVSLANRLRPFIKAPLGTSGTQNKRLLEASELDGTLGGWIRNVIEAQGGVLVEPWLDKVADLATQLDVGESRTRLLGMRRFWTGTRCDYRGTILDDKLGSLDGDTLRFLHQKDGPLERANRIAAAVGAALREAGYEGPAGIDAMIYRRENKIFLKPIVEVNPRWTMGRIALALEDHVAPGARAAWFFLRLRDLKKAGLAPNFQDAAAELRKKYPPVAETRGGSRRLVSGVAFTTDPATAQERLTVLAVGDVAVSELVF